MSKDIQIGDKVKRISDFKSPWPDQKPFEPDTEYTVNYINIKQKQIILEEYFGLWDLYLFVKIDSSQDIDFLKVIRENIRLIEI